MLKLQTPFDHAQRCGEVLCLGPAIYEVCCAMCELRLPYDEFLQHYQQEHVGGVPTEELHLQPVLIASEELEDPIAQHDEVHEVDLQKIALLEQKQEEELETETDKAVTLRTIRPCKRGRRPLIAMINDKLRHEKARTLREQDSNGDDDDDDEQDDTRDMLFHCELCDRAYGTKHSLQSHKRLKHNQVKFTKPLVPLEPPAETAAGSSKSSARGRRTKVYRCSEDGCGLTFRSERDLRGHRWKHTGIFCDICGKPFTQTGNMMRHRQRHSGIKPHKCEEPDCDATFYTQKELTSHSICHTGRMPCICEICGRPCRDRGVLTAHMRRHTGERPAKCNVCDKSFYSFHDLSVHSITHTTLRPFVCDICGSTFQRKKALKVHRQLHSDQRRFICKLCGKAFAQSGGLTAHMRTHEIYAPKPVAPTVELINPIDEVDMGDTTPTANLEQEELQLQQLMHNDELNSSLCT
ncbi:CG18262 [Drosophila busckii]|uniref:CG18262 n=1 Tax=Drosophila busckii TaxID=30019 RepID=A0A0M3QZ33_DROBS|nr:zinc finger protein 678 [Drosophila busckii]ALC48669.1 CG18262 [Drosophila busckii]